MLLPLNLATGQRKSRKPGQYKRVHQKALDLITAGKAEEAVEQLTDFAQKYPEDAEAQYMLTVAYTQLDKLDEAVASMQKALELRLPPGRFVAGPRDLLAPLAEREEFREMTRYYEARPVHGPMPGCVTDTSARLPIPTNDDTPIPRRLRRSSTAAPRGPDWEPTPTRPARAATGWYTANNPGPVVLTRPKAAGPSRRIP